jgi:hypothetical protein
LLGRLAAQDGPRLDNLAADGGDYGVAIPRCGGEVVRLTGIPLAQADIKEKRHTVQDYSEIIGAATGAIEGFMIGGPIGAAIGAVAGGILGALAPNQHYYTYSDRRIAGPVRRVRRLGSGDRPTREPLDHGARRPG